MKPSDVFNARTLKYAAVTIVLGAVGSGLWKWILRPVLAGSTDFLLSVGTLGVKAFKDSVYSEIGRGLHEGASLRLVALVFSFVPGMLMGFLVVFGLTVSRVALKKQPLPAAVANAPDSLMAAIGVALAVFVIAFSIVQGAQISYVNRAVTHFNQMLSIVGPHIDESEQALYRSRFAQIATREDYESLVRSLGEVCLKHKLRAPAFEVW